jgi:zinc protease
VDEGRRVTGPELDVREHRLANGLSVLLVPSRDAPVVAVSMWYRTGSRHDPPGRAGLAHLIEHMVYKGTGRFAKGEYDRILHAAGAIHNASTWFDRTNYYIVIGNDRYPLALELEADRMRGATLTPEDLRDEAAVVCNELQRNEDDPAFFERMQAAAFREHAYGRPVGGTIEQVRAITADDLRDFYDQRYRPGAAYLVVAGDYDDARILDEIEAAFGSIAPGSQPQGGPDRDPPPAPVLEPPQCGERRFELRKAGSHEMLAIAYKVPGRAHEDQYALDVLAQILGHGRTSRLYRALVETGVAVQAGAENLAALADPFLFHIDVDPARDTALMTLETAVDAEIERLRREPVTLEELARARKRARADFVLRRDRVTARASLIGELEASVGWRYQRDYLARLDAVSAQTVLEVARSHLVREERTVGIFRPTGEPEVEA